MSQSQEAARLALAHTIIEMVMERPLQRLSSGLYVPANSHGVMLAGLAGEVRVRAGGEVENELRGQRPLDLGRAYPTGAGRLGAAGVELIVHGVASVAPGESSRRAAAASALAAALHIFDESGIRAITLPLLQLASEQEVARGDEHTMAGLIAAHLRRDSRLRSITVAGLDSGLLEAIGRELVDAGATPA
jgi:hypothetical protein